MDERREPLEIVKDEQASKEEETVLRANLTDEKAVNEWLESYSIQTNTSWIVQKVQKVGERMVFHKHWRCQHHYRNKKAARRNANCMARVDIKIKLLNRSTMRNDAYLRRKVPLVTVIRIDDRHSHSTESPAALRLLRGTRSTRETFMRYFDDGMSIGEAQRLHMSKLCMEEDGTAKLATAALNPSYRTLTYWYDVWRNTSLNCSKIDPLSKLEEKASHYAAQGTHVTVTRGDDGTCWAVLVVTPIMRRAQDLELARDIVFIDSTAAFDTAKCTVTGVFVATKAGAIPIAALAHGKKTIDGYLAAFNLLKETHPLCFGGQAAPQVVMTSSSNAMKAALLRTWPAARQLLCHFHAVQAEWHWLTANGHVEKDHRHQLISAFQKVMYADTADKLKTATAELSALSHEASVARVKALLVRKQEWVLLYRSDIAMQSHYVNFTEATMRVLKDIIINKLQASNATAFVDAVVTIWENYFESLILYHAHGRVASQELPHQRLLSKMPDSAANTIRVMADGLYIVPSASHSGLNYEVAPIAGMCTCSSGKRGAFCKHQALIHDEFGGLFPDAPQLVAEDEHQLSKLAVGEKCSPTESLEPLSEQREFSDEDNNQSGGSTPRPLTPPPSLASPGLQEPDEAQLALAREGVYRSLEDSLRRLHAMNTHSHVYLETLKSLTDELNHVQNHIDAFELMVSFKEAVAAARHQRAVRVDGCQPEITGTSETAGNPATEPMAKRQKVQ